MTPFPNKATQFKSGPRQVEISRKGGLSTSTRKAFKAKLRYIKLRVTEGRLKTDDVDWLLERAADSDMMALDIISGLDALKGKVDSKTAVALSKVYLDMYKAIHGSKDSAGVIALSQSNVFSEVTINIIVPKEEEK